MDFLKSTVRQQMNSPPANFLGLFWKQFLARSPSKFVYIGGEGGFGKILGSVNQKWIS